MKQDQLTKVMDEVITLTLQAMDEVIEEVIEPIADIGSLEKLIGKKYEEWTDLDKNMMHQVDPKAFDDLVFRKEYPKLIMLEKEV